MINILLICVSFVMALYVMVAACLYEKNESYLYDFEKQSKKYSGNKSAFFGISAFVALMLFTFSSGGLIIRSTHAVEVFYKIAFTEIMLIITYFWIERGVGFVLKHRR